MHSRAFVMIVASHLVACGSSDSPAEPAQAIEPPPTTTSAPAEPAGPRVERESFLLEAKPNGTYAVGQAGSVTIEITPRSGWHVNMDFPTDVELSGGAELGFAKPRLARADAAAFEEQRVRFDAALTPTTAGARTASAVVHFATCNAETCLPQEAHLALPIEIR